MDPASLWHLLNDPNYQEPTMPTLHELAKECLSIQSASNLCGLAQRFAKVMVELSPHCPSGTDERNQHPIAQLWLEKMASLSGVKVGVGVPTRSYDIVFELAMDKDPS
jgi:hypothetical protein